MSKAWEHRTIKRDCIAAASGGRTCLEELLVHDESESRLGVGEHAVRGPALFDDGTLPGRVIRHLDPVPQASVDPIPVQEDVEAVGEVP